MRRFLVLQIVLLVAAVLQGPARAASLGLIDGTVHDYEDKPLTGTRVQLVSKDGRHVHA